jgi:hypothetical protein
MGVEGAMAQALVRAVDEPGSSCRRGRQSMPGRSLVRSGTERKHRFYYALARPDAGPLFAIPGLDPKLQRVRASCHSLHPQVPGPPGRTALNGRRPAPLPRSGRRRAFSPISCPPPVTSGVDVPATVKPACRAVTMPRAGRRRTRVAERAMRIPPRHRRTCVHRRVGRMHRRRARRNRLRQRA